MKDKSITIPRWFDRHLHIRDGDIMRMVLPYTLNQYATGAIIMPNLQDPITTIAKACAYREQILDTHHAHLKMSGTSHSFTPCMTCYLTDHTDPDEVVRGFKDGVWRAVKLYMANQQGQGGTTGSAHGVRDLRGCYPVFAAMERHSIPLLGHFEAVERDVDEFDREIVSVERDLEPILQAFPGLPVVFEHLTDGRAAELVDEYDHPGGLFATVTAHHLILNRNDMFWGGMNPINYCKPVPKREMHRAKVREYVTSGNPRFGAGTDSAPHDKTAKTRCCGCAAGIFTAPMAVELYTQVFDEDDALHHLGRFMSENFLHLYNMDVSEEQMTIERCRWQIPKKIEDAFGDISVPFFMGRSELQWKLIEC